MLNAGDIAIIGIKTELSDDFSFVALVDIAEGETIRFTDNGVLSDGTLSGTEGVVEWTAPLGGVTAGAVVSFAGNADFTAVSGFFALSTSGDQLIAYQGDEAAPSFLFAAQTNSTGFQAGATDANTSGLPAGLVLGLTAVAVGAGAGSHDEVDSAFYSGPLTGSRADLLALIGDAANWTGVEDAADYAAAEAFAMGAEGAFDLQITEIWMGDAEGSNLTADWIEITNTGTAAWRADAAGDLFFDDESADPASAGRLTGVDVILPGESAVFIDDDSIDEFVAVWGDRIDLSTVKLGLYSGAGLGQGGDAATLFLDGGAQGDDVLTDAVLLDYEAYPDANASGGASWDVTTGAFSEVGVNDAVATWTTNDEDEAAIASPGQAAAIPLPESAFTLELLHFSDQEAAGAAVSDAPALSGVLNALRAQDLGNDGLDDNTITLSSGDAIIPGIFYDAGQAAFGAGGAADMLIQKELGVQAIAFGNHEFDKGAAVIADLISGDADATVFGQDYAGTAFPYLSSNIDFSTQPDLAPLVVAGGQAPQGGVITSSVVLETGGEKIGVLGATTPTLGEISSPGSVGLWPADFDANPTEEQLDALAAVIQAEVEALLSANPDMNKVILLAHMQRIDIELALAERLSDVDIIVAGGSNTRLFDGNDVPRADDSVQGEYPMFVKDADGHTTAVVNTDGSYKYVGRLVIDFDDEGHIIAQSYDEEVSGAYATDEAGLAALNAEALIDPEIQAIADVIEAQIIATESNVFGTSDVFLNGNRSGVYADGTDPDGVRTQETNLGDLTADANLAAAKEVDGTVVVSIKNGGGIRASIGETVVPPGETEFFRLPNGEIVDSEGNVVKPEGGISQNDIQAALAFNNALSLVTLTTEQLVAVLEHGVSALPGVAGAFPQVSGVKFSFDETAPAGARIVNAGIFAEDGALIAELVRDGEIVDNGATGFRVVTLGFMADGGDGYPFPTEGVDRVNLDDLDGNGEADGLVTGEATFAADGTEQDALAEYLLDNFTVDPYAQEDTGRDGDERIQNLAFRADTVFAGSMEPAPSLWINEVDADNPSTDSVEFVELWDGGTGNTDLTGYALILINGSNDTVYGAIDLDGYATDADGFFVIGSALVDNVDLVAFTTNGVQNGQDGVALVQGDAADYAGLAIADLLDGNGHLNGLVDGLVYDTNDADDAALLSALNQSAQINEAENGDATVDSISRLPDGGDWAVQAPTPGYTNAPGEAPRPAADPAPAGAAVLSADALGTIALGGAEIVDFDAASGLAFVTSANGVNAVDASDPTNPTLAFTILPSLDGLSDDITSVAVANGIVAVAVPNPVKTDAGHVAFYSTAGDFLGAVEVGALPDMVTFDETGAYVLVANEGESSGADNEPDAAINPVGSVSVIAINADDLSASTVATLGFEGLNGMADELRAKGVRINDAAPSVAADIEPEYITIKDGKAIISLQENNAYAIIEDIANPTAFTIDDIITAGTVDHSVFGSGIDSSDKDGGIEILQRDVTGLRMPDGITAFAVGGVTFYASANEGDDRGVDAARGADLAASVDPSLTDLIDALTDETELGRLNLSTIDGDTDGDGDLDEVYSFGTRSFTIYDADGNVVFDSGDLIERIVAAEAPTLFNAEEGDVGEFDKRSDNKGPEPESVVFGEVDGKPYLFVGLERAGGVMAFDITDPSAPVYDQWIQVEGDLSPEGLHFISAEDSPTGAPLLAIANEVSGTLSFVSLAPEEVDYDLISSIQGSTAAAGGTIGVDDVSPYVGQTVTIQAVVTQDLQDGAAGSQGDLNGFFVQEEDADQDGDATTSEGIFIYDPSTLVDVSVGDLVTITGTVSEYFGLTQITVSSVNVVQSEVELPTATVVEFPTAGVISDGSGGWVADLEAYEGMLVTIPTELTVSELYNLDRYGEYVVTEGGRVAQFTQDNLPDAEGYAAFVKDLAARSVTLDDGISSQNPFQIKVVDGNDGILSATDTFSMGDTLTGVTGVVNYSFDLFRIVNPTGEYADAEVREETIDAGTGFKVASLNVLNYFTTIDTGADDAGPNDAQEPRGADSAEEFARQQTKLVNAIVEMDADVLGLMEIENDDDIAVANLVAAVNAALGSEVYGYIATGDLGGDAIAQALIYKLETAVPVGDFAALTEFNGVNFLDPLNAGKDLNRPALAQTFADAASGETITVVVNHLKSKGSLSGLAADEDQGDGAGNNNATRAAAAALLAEWLASDPTGSGSANQLIIGDLNSYAMEDPIQVLAAAGFTDLAASFIEDAYSYVFDGQVGTLDYALASESLLDDVVSVIEWHINSNEADAFDYNLDFGRDPSLFDGDTAARNSDHDPVIVTFDFSATQELTAGDDVYEAKAAAETIDLSAGGDDLISGAAAELDGDVVVGASEGDAVLFEGETLVAADFAFDGRFLTGAGATVDFGDDLGAGRFVIEQTAEGTTATWDAYDAIGEVQAITVGTTPITIQLQGHYENAVVFALPPSSNDGELVAVRIMETTGDTVTLMLQEPKAYDGIHADEQVTLLVVEAGVHTLADGTIIEAGEFDTNRVAAGRGFNGETFEADFVDTPSLFTQVQSFNGSDYVATREKNVTADGFSAALTKEEGITAHKTETIGWLAIEQGSGDWSGIAYETDTIEFAVNGNRGGASFSSAFDGAPNVIANLSSYIGDDHALARLNSVDEFGFEVRAQEDTSFDAEVAHAKESVDWIAFGGTGLLYEDDLDLVLSDALVA